MQCPFFDPLGSAKGESVEAAQFALSRRRRHRMPLVDLMRLWLARGEGGGHQGLWKVKYSSDF